MSDADLALTAESRGIINTFLTWAKSDRDGAVADCSRDVTMFRDGTIVQSTYTRAEAAALLDSVASTVRATVVSSHEKLTQSVAELMRCVLADADAQRVMLSVKPLDALNKHRAVSASELAAQKMLASGPQRSALVPMGGAGDAAKQLAQANDLIRSLREKLHAVEDRYRAVMDEQSRLVGKNHFLGDHLASEEQRLAQERQSLSATARDAATAGDKTVAQLQRDGAAAAAAHRDEVAALNKKVTDLTREQLGKLSESSQFQAMKTMLREKTARVKKLRDLLRPHNPAAAAGGDSDIATDDDDG